MPAHPRPLRAVWLDDDFGKPREPLLLRPYESWFNQQAIELAKASTLAEFGRRLQVDPPADLLIVDVMLHNELDETFHALGFDEDTILRMDAGVQVVALIRDRPHPPDAAHHWMERCRHIPVLLLSMSNIIDTIVSSYLPQERDRRFLTVVQKEYELGEVKVTDTLTEAVRQARLFSH
ncbi:MAG: hypothetical protein ACOZJX_11165 [Pseudomonadota bacterium]